jgi:hypothetical protein
MIAYMMNPANVDPSGKNDKKEIWRPAAEMSTGGRSQELGVRIEKLGVRRCEFGGRFTGRVPGPVS